MGRRSLPVRFVLRSAQTLKGSPTQKGETLKEVRFHQCPLRLSGQTAGRLLRSQSFSEPVPPTGAAPQNNETARHDGSL